MIAVDIDNTVCETTAHLWTHLLARLGLDPDLHPPRADWGQAPWDAHDWGVAGTTVPARAAPELIRLLRRAHTGADEDALLSAPPVPGARDVLLGLGNAGVDLRWATRRAPGPGQASGRAPGTERLTRAWLALHGFPELDFIACPPGLSKGDAARRAGATGLIEDDPREVRRVAGQLPVALRVMPYDDPRVPAWRFAHWKDLPVAALLPD